MIIFPNPGIIAGPRLIGGGVPFLVATLTIAAGEVTSDLTDFPVRVALRNMPSLFWTEVASDGSDIQVFDANSVQLPRDLVNFDNTNDMGDLFFKANLLTASDNVFYIAAGSGAAAPAVGSTYGRNATWSSYYRAFAFAGGSAVDRTGSGNDLTLVANAAFIQPTFAQQPDYYAERQYAFSTRDGAGQAQRAEGTVAYQGSWTIGTIAGNSTVGNNQEFGSYGLGWAANKESFGTFSNHNFFMYNPTEGTDQFTAPTNTWYGRHFNVMARNGTTNKKFWHNGVLKRTDTSTVQYPPSGSATVLTVGGGNGDCLKGYWDVFYMRATDSSDAWIAAEHNSWYVPSAFYTVT